MARPSKSEEGPDRGRAWLIAFAACIINMILSGISRMIGILYVAVIDEYGVSRQEATTPFSIRNSIRCLAGPLVGLVGHLVGIRTITFCGGIVAALGACLCSFAPNVFWLTIFWGGIHGGGFAFANTLFQVIVNQYFEKYRATASGIALSGACVGSLAFPFMFEAILNAYGLSGAFLILGGVVMHVLPPSILLCSPPWLNKRPAAQEPDVKSDVPNEGAADGKPEAGELQSDEKSHRTVLRSTSFSDYPQDGFQVLNVNKVTSAESDGINLQSAVSQQDSDGFSRNGKCSVKCISYKSKENEFSVQDNCEASDNKIATISNCYCQNGLPTVVEDDQEANASSDAKDTEKKKKKKGLLAGLISIFLLYKNPVYVLISVSMCAYIMIFIPILTVIVDYSKDKGMREGDGKFLINAMALGDLIGRLCFGWVTDKKFMAIHKFISLFQVLQGGVVAMFPLAQSLYAFMALLGLYGIMAGCVLVHFPILVMQYVPPEEQAVGMGGVGFMSGLVTFGIPPLIGHFRDDVGSYDGMFFWIGGISLFSGAVWMLVPVLARIHKANQNRAACSGS